MAGYLLPWIAKLEQTMAKKPFYLKQKKKKKKKKRAFLNLEEEVGTFGRKINGATGKHCLHFYWKKLNFFTSTFFARPLEGSN